MSIASPRIVTLLPAASEMVCALGLREFLTGVSHECDYPDSLRILPKVTKSLMPEGLSSEQVDQVVASWSKDQRALYALDSDLLVELAPDVIVTQSLCQVCAVSDRDVEGVIDRLSKNAKVVRLSPVAIEDIFLGLRQIAEAVGDVSLADPVVAELRRRVAMVQMDASKDACSPRVVHLEWVSPLYSSGHWSPEIISLAGGNECIGQPGKPSQRIDWQDILSADPDVLLVSCCGYDLARNAKEMELLKEFPGYWDLKCVQSGRIYPVDGNSYFSRPGPRLIDTLELVRNIIGRFAER